jgi:hypothetical protein
VPIALASRPRRALARARSRLAVESARAAVMESSSGGQAGERTRVGF